MSLNQRDGMLVKTTFARAILLSTHSLNKSRGDSANPQTLAELEEEVDTLVQAAYENGVEIDEAAISLRHSDPIVPDWQVHFTRLTKRSKSTK